jgi:hypothetical protein
MAPENSRQRGSSIDNPKFSIDSPLLCKLMTNASGLLVLILHLVASIYRHRRIEDLEIGDIIQLVVRDARPILRVGVRSNCETAIPMIPGAITRRNFECRIGEIRENLAVAYCTVGGRSFFTLSV